MGTRRTSPYGASTAFCVIASIAMIAVRLLLFESCILRRACIPNHDMSQGLAFFATNVHSLRLTGDIAWWNPISRDGYAQYFQSFLSPLAPTPHHVVFIVWAYLVRVWSRLGVELPSEYVQYIAFNYLLFPFLTYWMLGELARRIVRHRTAVLLVVVVYALSSIGVWNSTWFYFQESFALFFLLGSFLGAMQNPGRREIGLLLAAVLVQVSSLNYWSVFNALFIFLFCGTYIAFHLRQSSELLASVARLLRSSGGARIVALLAVVTAIAWLTLTRSIAHDQSDAYFRTVPSQAAIDRVKRLRTFTIEFFNPGIEIALENYPALTRGGWPEPPVHNARYLGAALLPLLILSPFGRGRQAPWVFALALETFVVCLAPPFIAKFVGRIPFLNQIQHLFYFYTTHLQLLVVLVAGLGLDAALQATAKLRAPLARASKAIVGVAILGGFLMWRFRQDLPGLRDHSSDYIRAVGIGVASSLLLGVLASARTRRSKAALSSMLLSLLSVDLGFYFAHVTRIDRDFTLGFFGLSNPLADDVRQALLQPMPSPDPARGTTGGLEHGIPFMNNFWPQNDFMILRAYRAFETHPEPGAEIAAAKAFEFYRQANPPTNPLILLHKSDSGEPHLDWRWTQWDYNTYAVRVTTADDGWLFIRRTFDPRWRITVDGEPANAQAANYVDTALRLHRGTHEIRGSYRPLARALYWPSCALLLGTLLVLLASTARDSFRRCPGLSRMIRAVRGDIVRQTAPTTRVTGRNHLTSLVRRLRPPRQLRPCCTAYSDHRDHPVRSS